MSEWWTYRPEDFLLFSPRVYWRMFELHNAALWPLQVLALAAGLIIILLVAWRPRSSARWLALLLAILWIFVGWSFLWNRYAAINWAAAYVAPAFAVEGVLLLVVRAFARRPRLRPARACRLDRIFHPCLRTRRTAVARAATGTWLGLVRGFWHRAGSDGDRDARPSAPRPRQAFAIAPTNPRSLVPLERHNPSDDGRAASVGSSCRAGTRRCRLHLDDHPSARIASNRVMHAKDDDRSQARPQARATPRSANPSAPRAGGYGLNAVRRNVRFARWAQLVNATH